MHQRKCHNYELQCIGNMDETPVCFDMPAARTMEKKGTKTVLVKTTDLKKSRFTVTLACLADGTKLSPFVLPPSRWIKSGVKDWEDFCRDATC